MKRHRVDSLQDATGSISSELKLSMASFHWTNGKLYYIITYGLYWSGNYSNNDLDSRDMHLKNNKVFLNNTTHRGTAMPVRCIKD